MFRPKIYPSPKKLPEQRLACSVHFPCLLVRVKNLLKYVDPNSPKIYEDGIISYALHQAALKGQNNIVSVLIASGADSNLKQKDKNTTNSYHTPLHLAVRYEHLSTIGILLSNGADPNSPKTFDNGDITYALHEAARKGQDKIVRVLIASGADVNLKWRKTNSHATPLHLAVEHEHLKGNTR